METGRPDHRVTLEQRLVQLGRSAELIRVIRVRWVLIGVGRGAQARRRCQTR